MRQIIFILIPLLAIVSCGKQEYQDKNTKAISPKTGIPNHTSSYTIDSLSYKGQLPYLSSVSTAEDSGKEMFDSDMTVMLKDSSKDWEDFDQLYSTSLSVEQKQRLGYLILSQKDLIGLLHNDPTNSTLQDAVKKYVEILVDTDYIGYCVLYYALIEINDSPFVESMAEEITRYGADDPFSTFFLDEPLNESIPYYDKVEENYSYLHEIGLLQ